MLIKIYLFCSSPETLLLTVATIERHGLALHAPWIPTPTEHANPKSMLGRCLCGLAYAHATKTLTGKQADLEHMQWKTEMLDIYRHLECLNSIPVCPVKVETAAGPSLLAHAIGSPHLVKELGQWMHCAENTWQSIQKTVKQVKTVPDTININYTFFLEFMCIHSVRSAPRSRADRVSRAWSSCSSRSSIRQFAASVCHRILVARMHARGIAGAKHEDEEPSATQHDTNHLLSQSARIWTHLPPESAAHIFVEWWWWWTCHRGRAGEWGRGWLWRELTSIECELSSSNIDNTDAKCDQVLQGIQLLCNAVTHIQCQLTRHGARNYLRALRTCVDATAAAFDENDPARTQFDAVLLTRQPLAVLVLAQIVLSALTTDAGDHFSDKPDRDAEADAWRSLQSHARKLLLLRCSLLCGDRAPVVVQHPSCDKPAVGSAPASSEGGSTTLKDWTQAQLDTCEDAVAHHASAKVSMLSDIYYRAFYK